MTVLLRPATPDDRDELARIWHEGWWDAHPYFAPQLGPERTLASFVERMGTRIPITTVAEADGRVLGFAVIHHDELEQLFVDRAGRGKGIAPRLIAHAEAAVAAAGYPLIWLAVATENHHARRFYAKSGWVERDAFEYQAETTNGPVPVPCFRCERRLRD